MEELSTTFDEMDKDEVEIGKVVGKGNYGMVYSCRLKSTAGSYALKVITLPSEQSDEHKFLNSVRSELQILRTLRHPNIVILHTPSSS